MSTDAYLDAKAAFERIDRKVRDVGRQLSAVGTALATNPSKFIFANLSLGLPMEASMSRDSVSVDANNWLSAIQIQTLLSEWHNAKADMMGAWSNVPNDRRSNLVAPDGLRR